CGATATRAGTAYRRDARVIVGEGIRTKRWERRRGMEDFVGRPLFPLQLDDLVRLGAAGRDDLDLRAFLLADQRAGERRGDGDPALLGVGLRLADDLPHRL